MAVYRVNTLRNTFFLYFSEGLLHHSNTSRQNRGKWRRKMCSANECKFINLHLKRWAGKPSINKQCFAVFFSLFLQNTPGNIKVYLINKLLAIS